MPFCEQFSLLNIDQSLTYSQVSSFFSFPFISAFFYFDDASFNGKKDFQSWEIFFCKRSNHTGKKKKNNKKKTKTSKQKKKERKT